MVIIWTELKGGGVGVEREWFIGEAKTSAERYLSRRILKIPWVKLTLPCYVASVERNKIKPDIAMSALY